MKYNKKAHSAVTFYTLAAILFLTLCYKGFVLFSYMAAGEASDGAVSSDIVFIVFMLIPMLLCAAATLIISARTMKFYSRYTFVMLIVTAALSLLSFIEPIYRFMLVFGSIAAQAALVGFIYDIYRTVKAARTPSVQSDVPQKRADGVISNISRPAAKTVVPKARQKQLASEERIKAAQKRRSESEKAKAMRKK